MAYGIALSPLTKNPVVREILIMFDGFGCPHTRVLGSFDAIGFLVYTPLPFVLGLFHIK
jgi:hypothetical protein